MATCPTYWRPTGEEYSCLQTNSGLRDQYDPPKKGRFSFLRFAAWNFFLHLFSSARHCRPPPQSCLSQMFDSREKQSVSSSKVWEEYSARRSSSLLPPP
ncbi:uncharacterized protein V6R79_017150 [Siganus canaliculatus]